MRDAQTALQELAQREIARIRELPQPVVRVCGPLTADGPEGYERNTARLTRAEKILADRGMSVWNFDQAEAEIFGKNYNHDDIFNYFHRPVLKSGLIKTAYFLPRWEESSGATHEHTACQQLGIEIKEFLEKWFGDELTA